MFRTLIYPSSGACDCAVELLHRSFCSRFVVCWRFGVAGFEWCPCCRLQPHQISNTQRTKNKTTDVVIQQHSRKLLMMDVLMSETCWVHKKWNKIASDIKLVFILQLLQCCWMVWKPDTLCTSENSSQYPTFCFLAFPTSRLAMTQAVRGGPLARPAFVRFMVGRVTLGQVFVRVL